MHLRLYFYTLCLASLVSAQTITNHQTATSATAKPTLRGTPTRSVISASTLSSIPKATAVPSTSSTFPSPVSTSTSTSTPTTFSSSSSLPAATSKPASKAHISRRKTVLIALAVIGTVLGLFFTFCLIRFCISYRRTPHYDRTAAAIDRFRIHRDLMRLSQSDAESRQSSVLPAYSPRPPSFVSNESRHSQGSEGSEKRLVSRHGSFVSLNPFR
ncbi:hypothetical protein C8J56DRAFT_194044 [Mycena floridula]|nr:hypothetical protein C8J56DRAFT_194044 [Mycena floridula]